MKLTNTNIHNVKRHLNIEHLNKNGYDISFFDVARIVTIGYDRTMPILNLDFHHDLHKIYMKLADDFTNYMDNHWETVTNLSNAHFVIINDEIKLMGIKGNTLFIIDTDN